MPKIGDEERKKYVERLRACKEEVGEIKRQEARLDAIIETGQAGTAYKRIILSDVVLNGVSYDLFMNSLSLTLLGIKNETNLNSARKGCYKAIINLEKTVSNNVEAPFSEYADMLDDIAEVGDETRFFLLRKLGYSIDSVIEGFGTNSKWRWSFVEIEARFATVAKNMINLKAYHAGMDPRKQGYQARQGHMKLVMELLQKAADGYRQKYELSTLRQDDFRVAINYLSAMRRLHILLGNTTEAGLMKKKIEAWRTKMETDQKEAEKTGKTGNQEIPRDNGAY